MGRGKCQSVIARSEVAHYWSLFFLVMQLTLPAAKLQRGILTFDLFSYRTVHLTMNSKEKAFLRKKS